MADGAFGAEEALGRKGYVNEDRRRWLFDLLFFGEAVFDEHGRHVPVEAVLRKRRGDTSPLPAIIRGRAS